MNYFYRQFISHITVVYVVVLSHDITGGATGVWGKLFILKSSFGIKFRIFF
ncbi:hypothetical protein [Leptospira noguchii]|uniref:hypothetical protein n=1 Tax=Leptospira noguchii TaxID=28182 RepID=UPI0002FF818D|nr:hypothetical protein [Leptospira noguchii]